MDHSPSQPLLEQEDLGPRERCSRDPIDTPRRSGYPAQWASPRRCRMACCLAPGAATQWEATAGAAFFKRRAAPLGHHAPPVRPLRHFARLCHRRPRSCLNDRPRGTSWAAAPACWGHHAHSRCATDFHDHMPFPKEPASNAPGPNAPAHWNRTSAAESLHELPPRPGPRPGRLPLLLPGSRDFPAAPVALPIRAGRLCPVRTLIGCHPAPGGSLVGDGLGNATARLLPGLQVGLLRPTSRSGNVPERLMCPGREACSRPEHPEPPKELGSSRD